MYLVGLDVGTTGAKAMVLDLTGKIISSGYREYPCIYPNKGWVEQDSELLVEKSFEACREAVSRSGVDIGEIKAVGFSVQRGTFGLLDENNQVLDNRFYVWQDNRAASEIEYIKKIMPEKELYNIQGQPVTPTFSLEKLVWLQRNEPHKLEQAKRFALVSDYVMYRFGVDDIYTEVTNAGCSAMLDIVNLKWSGKILAAFGLKESLLPKLVKPGQAIGKINRQTAVLSGLKEGTLLCTGSGDNQCGALGAGVVKPGNASMSLGTSGVLVVADTKPVFVDNMGLMVNPSSVYGIFQMEGIQLGAASSYKWARDNLAVFEKVFGQESGIDSYTLMEKHLEKTPAGANGVIFMPFLMGSGYPYWNPEASGLFAGVSLSTTKSDLIRAVMEGITFESKDMYENMKKSGVIANCITIIGGATKSPVWRQMIADMFNVQVRRLKISDATIIGAAILAGVGAGLFSDPEEGVAKMVHFTDEVEPIAGNVEKYNQIYQVYKKLYQVNNENGIYSDLAKL